MISVVIPAYNEEGSVKEVLERVKSVFSRIKEKSEIILVNDGSADKTAEIASGVSGVRVVSNPVNRGYGASLKAGIRAAKGEWILISDADGTYPIERAPDLLKERESYDMVVGARTGESVKIPLHRKPGKWVLSRLANYLSGSRIPDLNSGLRVFRKADSLRFFNILPNGFSFTTTITLAYLCNSFSVKYIPIDYHVRVGKSKIKPVRDGVNFMVLIVRTTTYFNPLKVFLPFAIAVFLVGLFAFLYQLVILRNVAELPVFLIIVAIQVGFLGLLADLIVRKSGDGSQSALV